MSDSKAVVTSIAICVAAAAIEGLCAGKNVKSFFSSLTFPRYSAPLWVWSIIGAGYYAVFGFIVFRLLRIPEGSMVKTAALILVLAMMLGNGLSNYVIFRARDLRFSFVIGTLFPVADLSLFLLLSRLDSTAAMSLVPYLMYRVYAVWWGYSLWKANPGLSSR
jgi:tryptophan-rich sensory protein